jgi:hypothetical protein
MRGRAIPRARTGALQLCLARAPSSALGARGTIRQRETDAPRGSVCRLLPGRTTCVSDRLPARVRPALPTVLAGRLLASPADPARRAGRGSLRLPSSMIMITIEDGDVWIGRSAFKRRSVSARHPERGPPRRGLHVKPSEARQAQGADCGAPPRRASGSQRACAVAARPRGALSASALRRRSQDAERPARGMPRWPGRAAHPTASLLGARRHALGR